MEMTYNLDMINKFDGVVEDIEGIGQAMTKGATAFSEVANITKAQKLIATANSQVNEGLPTLLKAQAQLVEITEKIKADYRRRDEALNG